MKIYKISQISREEIFSEPEYHYFVVNKNKIQWKVIPFDANFKGTKLASYHFSGYLKTNITTNPKLLYSAILTIFFNPDNEIRNSDFVLKNSRNKNIGKWYSFGNDIEDIKRKLIDNFAIVMS